MAVYRFKDRVIDPQKYPWGYFEKTYYFDPEKALTTDNFVLLNNNQRVECVLSGTDQSAITKYSITGKIYFEIEAIVCGSVNVIGVCNATHTELERIGFNSNSWGWMANGRLYHNSSYSSVVGFTQGDLLQCAVDTNANKVWFGKNGTWIESGDPENGLNPAFEDAGIVDGIFGAYGVRYEGEIADLFVLSTEFTYTPPTGFYSLSGR